MTLHEGRASLEGEGEGREGRLRKGALQGVTNFGQTKSGQFVRRSGVLGRWWCPLEMAAAQICREAARVSTNVYVRDLDLAAFKVLNGRRLEVVADRLTLFRSAQLAIDTTIVFPLHRDWTPHKKDALVLR